jgi:DNA mismatch repair protein MutL
VRWRLLHDERVLLDALPAPGLEGPRRRIAQLFGAELAARLWEIGEGGGAGGVDEIVQAGEVLLTGDVGHPGEIIGGLVGSPETVRGRRQFVFVNRRLLRDRAVLGVFYRTVRETWRSDEFPALFLFLDVPPEELDVNVHPQKAEVRFRDPRLLDRLAAALARGLERARGEVAAPLRSPAGAPAAPFAWEGLGGRPTPAGDQAGEVAEGVAPPPPAWPPPVRLAMSSVAPAERAPVPLSGRHGEARPFRLLGQYKGTLILLEGPDGLYLIDQHVAHERILYERLRRSLAAASPPAQTLLQPALLELGPAERLRLETLAGALEDCGFGLAALSGQTLALTAVPAVLSAAEAERLLLALAADSDGGDESDASAAGRFGQRLLDALAASQACKSAVKMHHPLSAAAMEALVSELFAAEQPYACPHGRPIVLQMTDSDLERRFGRR